MCEHTHNPPANATYSQSLGQAHAEYSDYNIGKSLVRDEGVSRMNSDLAGPNKVDDLLKWDLDCSLLRRVDLVLPR